MLRISEALYEWMPYNHLRLNPRKTQLIWLSIRGQIFTDDLQLRFRGTSFSIIVTLNPKLTFHSTWEELPRAYAFIWSRIDHGDSMYAGLIGAIRLYIQLHEGGITLAANAQTH